MRKKIWKNAGLVLLCAGCVICQAVIPVLASQTENGETVQGETGQQSEQNAKSDGEAQKQDIYKDTISEPSTGAQEETGTVSENAKTEDKVQAQTPQESSYDESNSNLGGAAASANGIVIDGYYDDWNEYPESYEYNWDNSSNCWQWGVWIDGVKYTTPEGTYDTNVRHKMQIACDGTYVYLHIVYSRDYGSGVNGDDFQFWVGDAMARFSLTNGSSTITGTSNGLSAGVYDITVRHGDGAVSWQVAEGAEGKMTVKDEHVNTELEIKIPLSELERQNAQIDAENIETISFFTPNLMYRKINATGTGTGTTVGLLLMAGAAVMAAGNVARKRHGRS